MQECTSFEPPVNLEDQNEFSFAAVLRRALCSGKFFAMCILVTIAAVLSFSPTTSYIGETGMSYSSGADIWAILTSVAMWITYANAKSSTPVMSVGGLKFNATLMSITFVINWIGAVLLLICGVLFFVMTPMLNAIFADEVATEMFWEEMAAAIEASGFEGYVETLTDTIILTIFVAIAVAFVVFGVIMILLNIFYYGKLKHFAKNLHISYITNKATDLRCQAISVWLMVMGILGAVSSLSAFAVNSMLAVSAISGAATMIVASIWVKELGEAVSQPEETM